MNDHAYDISHLLETEPAFEVQPVSRVTKVVPRVVEDPGASVAAAQEALAQELLGADAIHEEMIRRYLSMTDESQLD